MVKEEYDPGNKDWALFIGAISATEREYQLDWLWVF